MRVAVNIHALPIYKKNRIASLLCIFETIINNVFCVFTEIMAQDDTIILNKTTPHFQLLPMSKVDQS